MNNEPELINLLRVFIKRKKLLLSGVIILFMISAVYLLFFPEEYYNENILYTEKFVMKINDLLDSPILIEKRDNDFGVGNKFLGKLDYNRLFFPTAIDRVLFKSYLQKKNIPGNKFSGFSFKIVANELTHDRYTPDNEISIYSIVLKLSGKRKTAVSEYRKIVSNFLNEMFSINMTKEIISKTSSILRRQYSNLKTNILLTRKKILGTKKKLVFLKNVKTLKKGSSQVVIIDSSMGKYFPVYRRIVVNEIELFNLEASVTLFKEKFNDIAFFLEYLEKKSDFIGLPIEIETGKFFNEIYREEYRKFESYFNEGDLFKFNDKIIKGGKRGKFFILLMLFFLYGLVFFIFILIVEWWSANRDNLFCKKLKR